MQNISNLTLGQIYQHFNLVNLVIACSIVLNFEVIVRKVAANRGNKEVMNICDHVAGIISFILEVIDSAAKKNTKVIPLILICIGLIFSTGCAMIPPHAVNVDIAGHNLETPYGKIEDGSIHIHTIWGDKAQAVIIPASNVGVGTTSTASIPVTVTVTPTK